MTLLGREQILSRTDLRHEDVPVPEWGGTVRVREMTGTELDAYQASMMQQQDDGKGGVETVPEMSNLRSKLLVLAIIDEDGANIFNEFDIANLGRTSGAALDRVFTVAQRLSGLNQAAAEEAAENFGGDRNGNSIST